MAKTWHSHPKNKITVSAFHPNKNFSSRCFAKQRRQLCTFSTIFTTKISCIDMESAAVQNAWLKLAIGDTDYWQVQTLAAKLFIFKSEHGAKGVLSCFGDERMATLQRGGGTGAARGRGGGREGGRGKREGGRVRRANISDEIQYDQTCHCDVTLRQAGLRLQPSLNHFTVASTVHIFKMSIGRRASL